MIRIIPDGVNINFIGNKGKIFVCSIILTVSSVLFLLIKGLNYGIDFKGGYVIEARFPSPPNLDDLRKQMANNYKGDFSLQQLGVDGRDIVIKLDADAAYKSVTRDPSSTDQQVLEQQVKENPQQIIDQIKEFLGQNVEYRKVETIGPTVGKELINNAIKAIILSIFAIAIYVAIRFEWQFAVCGLIALAQDCIGIIGAYSILWIDFNATAIVAILTTASYSINDSIVIFDRIRENIKRYKKMPIEELINKSINDTLSRTVLTAGTTLLAVLALCIWGGDVISAFSIPIFIGIGLGTISSIALSAPLLLLFNLNRDKIAMRGLTQMTVVK
ncbi:MAG: protein translocase subunit SecF [Holosporales bacterium]|jgi:preprotein translocase SecF subunit|nr:protein translocase subunit SecF [Holosporales bacterium]